MEQLLIRRSFGRRRTGDPIFVAKTIGSPGCAQTRTPGDDNVERILLRSFRVLRRVLAFADFGELVLDVA
jgi:hypothetical protein